MANTGNIVVTETDINPFSSTYQNTRTRTYQDWTRCVPDGYWIYVIGYTNHFEEYVPCPSEWGTRIPDGYASGLPTTSGSVGQVPNVEEVYIGSCVTAIGNAAFTNCKYLWKLGISDTVTEIGGMAFNGCDYIRFTNLYIPDSVVTIGGSAFSDCSHLAAINIPNSVTTLGNMAFYNCTDAATLTIGTGITSIGAWAFSNCTSLTSATILATTPPTLGHDHEGSHAFDNTNNCPIYVPAASVNAYKTAQYWSVYADRIQSLS